MIYYYYLLYFCRTHFAPPMRRRYTSIRVRSLSHEVARAVNFHDKFSNRGYLQKLCSNRNTRSVMLLLPWCRISHPINNLCRIHAQIKFVRHTVIFARGRFNSTLKSSYRTVSMVQTARANQHISRRYYIRRNERIVIEIETRQLTALSGGSWLDWQIRDSA